MEVANVADNSTLRQEIAMDNSVIAQISEVEGRVVKTLILPDGQYQVRTYQGDGDTGARLFGTYVDPAEAEKEHQAAADVWLKP